MVDKTAATIKLKVKNEQRCNVNVLGLSLKIKLMKLIKLQSKMSKGAMSMSLDCPSESGL